MSRSKGQHHKKRYPCGSSDCGWCRKDELKRAQKRTVTKEQREALDELILLNVEMGLYDDEAVGGDK